MTTSSYFVGNLVRISCTFQDTSGNAIDPTTVTFKIKDGGGTITTTAPTKLSTGNYYYDFTVATAGTHYYRFAGTGTVVAANEGSFNATATQVV